MAQRALKESIMNLNHAFGFLFVGTVFGLLPRFAPGLCPVTGVDGTSAREIWLQLMSALLIGIALVYTLQRMFSGLATLMEYDPQRRLSAGAAQALPDAVELPVAPTPVARARVGAILPMPAAAFRGGLLEQRPAA